MKRRIRRVPPRRYRTRKKLHKAGSKKCSCSICWTILAMASTYFLGRQIEKDVQFWKTRGF